MSPYSHNDRDGLSLIILVLLLIVGCAGVALGADGSHARMKSTLTSMGFTDIHLTGYAFFGCGGDDIYTSGFTAKNPHGAPVDGVVCCGAIKSCTVRF